MSSRAIALAFATVALAPFAPGEPLSRGFAIDFFRDVPSRNLEGMATRSDGRLLAGPVLTDLNGPPVPELLWTLEPAASGKWLVGAGPEGRIVEVTLNDAGTSYTVRDVADLDEPQVLALKQLPDGSLLAGTSPNGVLLLVRDGSVAARVALPVDSIFDIALRGDRAYVATGNPGRIYEVQLPRFASAGMERERVRESTALEARGLRLFAEVRDRNVRRIAWLGDQLVAGSSPKGNVYAFDMETGSPVILQENRDAEVSALLPQPNGDLYAAVVFSSIPGESRINRPSAPKPEGSTDTPPPPPPAPPDRFGGRSSLVYFPKNGFPETVVTRNNLAFYALARRGDILVIAGGEQGDLLGYDLNARQSLSFPGTDSAQLNAIVPIEGREGREPTRFLALRNNVPGLAVVDFAREGVRSAETRRLDLGIPSALGAVRIPRLRNARPEQVQVDLRTNLGSDEIEGWGPWQTTERRADGWLPKDARARTVRLKFNVEGSAAAAELDDAVLYHLPQNRRPNLAEFRVMPSNYALLPAAETVPSAVTTLNQLINPRESDDRRRSALLASQVVPAPGSQIVTWNVSDPDNDAVASTFSIRREGSDEWTDLAVNSRAGYAQFDTRHLEDGAYVSRLVVMEQAPRPEPERLSATFDTEDILIDNSAPSIAEITVAREGAALRVTVSARDAFSLLRGTEVVLNNGYQQEVTQPIDGIRDSQAETFSILIPAADAAHATSVEVSVFDMAGNSETRRTALPR